MTNQSQIDALIRKCTPKQRLYIQARLEGADKTAAYIKAFEPSYGGKNPQGAIGGNAVKLERKPHIAAILDYYLKEKVRDEAIKTVAPIKAAGREIVISKASVTQELAKIAFNNPKNFYVKQNGLIRLKDWDNLTEEDMAAVTEMSIDTRTTTDKDGKVTVEQKVKVKTANKRAALFDLAQIMGMIVHKHQMRAVMSVRDLTDEELEAMRQEALASADAKMIDITPEELEEDEE